jgi:hypothetical protein
MSPLVPVPVSVAARSRVAFRIVLAALLLAGVGGLASAASAAGAAADAPVDPDPGKTVTLADVEKVVGGKFTSRSPEPGVLFYEEAGGARQINVYLWPANGKSLADLKPNLVSNGEPIEEVAGLGDGAIFRPQGSEVLVEVTRQSGELLWLTISVHNVDGPGDVKRIAVELAKRGVARL